jgi:alkylhydroperoxidase family enzyme
MSKDYQQIINDLTVTTLNGPGHSSSELRNAVADYARAVSLEEAGDRSKISPELFPYLDKVSLYAYKVLDREVDALKARDFSEDEIFELTVSAALGAGLARLERGLALLDG